jgi:hypothetical protein
MSAESDHLDFSSPTVPVSAVFVAADEPLLVFSTAGAAEGYLEAIDVESGVYPIGYGPRGEPYSITTDGNRVLVQRTGEPSDPDALKALLIRYLEAQRQRVSDTMPLSELTAAVWTIERQELHGARSSAWSCLLGVVAIGALLVVLFKLV